MKALVVYESMFGNTREIAEAIGEGLATTVEATVVEVGHAPTDLAGVDLLVVGGPTHAFGMSRPQTRESATEHTTQPLVSQGPGIREWLGGLGRRPGMAAAAFDTKVDKPVPGSASGSAGKRLRKLGFRLVVPPESFRVDDMTGPLLAGELTRAHAWGAGVGSRLTSAATAGSPR